TFWDPPARLEWESCVDDVLTTVTFLPSDEGTVVTVEHTIPDGGEDRGGTSWSRVVPAWFGAWCAKRDRVEHVRRDIARLSLALTYARPVAAAHWLRNVFGFAS